MIELEPTAPQLVIVILSSLCLSIIHYRSLKPDSSMEGEPKYVRSFGVFAIVFFVLLIASEMIS